MLRRDKAYSSRGHRALLRRRGIQTVIPNPPSSSDTAAAEAAAGLTRRPDARVG